MSVPTLTARGWFLRGAAGIASVPALVLLSAQVGFGALARNAGLTTLEAMAVTLFVWALPSQVVYVGVTAAGAGLPAVMLAVALSAVRLMPMTMAWVPVVRGPRTPRWQLYLMSWGVAVTAWVFAMSRLPALPRETRAPYFAGFAVTLTLASTVAVGISHGLLGTLPQVVAGALAFLTPVYFMMALFGAARADADRYALGIGLVLGPVAGALVPGLSILVAGLVGGTLAFALARMVGPRA